MLQLYVIILQFTKLITFSKLSISLLLVLCV
jgi:hypothetical protein